MYLNVTSDEKCLKTEHFEQYNNIMQTMHSDKRVYYREDIHQMNTFLLEKMLTAYHGALKENFDKEKDKWEDLSQFQKRFYSSSSTEPIIKRLQYSLNTNSNLISTRNYQPFDKLSKLAKDNPSKIEEALETLLDEKIDIIDRIRTYQAIINSLNEGSPGKTSSAADIRFITTLLWFTEPEKYMAVKYTQWRNFCKEYDLGIKIKKDNIETIFQAETIINIISDYVKNTHSDIVEGYRKAIEELRKEKPDIYQDKDLRLFVQNLIWYAGTYYKKEELDELKGKEEPESFEDVVFAPASAIKSRYVTDPLENGVHLNYAELEKKKKIIGDCAENFVLRYERWKNRTVEWVSKNKGDGLGYDILSTDKDGHRRYIEVKGTRGPENEIFYITATELAACEKYGDDYFLYRVYVKDGKQAITYYQGEEIVKLCNAPCLYAVKI